MSETETAEVQTFGLCKCRLCDGLDTTTAEADGMMEAFMITASQTHLLLGRIFRTCVVSFATALFALVAGHAGSANAQVATKEIIIYNNSKETIYPMLQTPAMTFPDNPDIWLQGFFAVPNISTQTFLTSFNYEAFINIDHGIAPEHFVSITIPFYTQLKAPGPGGVGATSDEYIDWWNAGRLFLFDSHTAATGAFYYNNDGAAPPVTPYPGNAAALPSCIDDKMVACPVNVSSYNVAPITNIPFQLVEYTSANPINA